LPIGQESGAKSSAGIRSISSNRSNGPQPIAVEPVDKGDDRHLAQPADLEELPGLLLDAPLASLWAASSTITALSTAVRVR
jgi:hypothetical protein